MPDRPLVGLIFFADFAGSDRGLDVPVNDLSREISHA